MRSHSIILSLLLLLPSTLALLAPSPRRYTTCLPSTINENSSNIMENTGVVILAGGTGSRMKSSIPKQFLPLSSIPIIQHSLNLFTSTLPSRFSATPLGVVIVMAPEYHSSYPPPPSPNSWTFAPPGSERQGSVSNGLQALKKLHPSMKQICIHDSARPLVTPGEVLAVVADAAEHGAAVLAAPTKSTIKMSEDGEFVAKTMDRSKLWEIATPQVVGVGDLERGFEKVERESLDVTDDASIIELLGLPVKLTRGEYTNIKVTTPEDIQVAEAILARRRGE